MMKEDATSSSDEKEESGIKLQRAEDTRLKDALVYGVDDVPPIHMTFLFGLQQVFLSISSSISIPLIVADSICARELHSVKAELLGTFLVMCGVSTILQCVLGVRLPIIQGGCHKFIPAVFAVMSLERWRCPDTELTETVQVQNALNITVHADNGTISMHPMNDSEIWQSRLREIQGSIMVASLTQVVLGTTGVVGFLLRFIGPLTLAPTITLVGLSLFEVAFRFCEVQWGIACLTLGLLLLFSLYLSKVKIPLLACKRKRGFYVTRYPVFKILPVIFAIVISWSLCAILTAYNVFPSDPSYHGYGARVDAKVDVLHTSRWFYFPYPGQWGLPTVSLASYVAMMAATVTSIIESVGDYYACARVCQVPPPPSHAINRGCAVEGFSSILSGAFGSGGATTSYSQNVGAIGFTKVGSRSAFVMAGVIFLLCGIFGKFGAILTMMPPPILGAIVTLSFGMVSAVGLSSLQFIKLGSSRNQTILGFSLIMGLMVPGWFHDNQNAINSGIPELDRVIVVLLTTPMFVGGMLGCVLDNTVPGSEEERGILKWRQETYADSECDKETLNQTGRHSVSVYDLPFISPWLRNQKWAKYVPVLPSFSPKLSVHCRGRARKAQSNDTPSVQMKTVNCDEASV